MSQFLADREARVSKFSCFFISGQGSIQQAGFFVVAAQFKQNPGLERRMVVHSSQ